MSSYSEDEIIPVALELIRNNQGIRTSELIQSARQVMNPTGEDLEILNGRSDDKFSQKVRNIKSHDSIADRVRTVGERDRQWFID